MKHKGLIITISIVTIVWIIGGLITGNYINNRREHLKSYVGEKVLYDKDTVTIVSYHFWTAELKTSKGYWMSTEYADKNLINE